MEAGGASSASSLPALDNSQHALRKAGEEFFEQFLEQARRGRNPLDAAPRTKRKADVEVGDAEDLETVGRILPYVFGVLLFASASAKLVMAKVIILNCKILSDKESNEEVAVRISCLHTMPVISACMRCQDCIYIMT